MLHRWVPPGAPPNWPGDSVSPQVELGEGIWSFTLWVVDNEGAISAPSTITVTVGMVTNPAVQQCADAVVATESASCRQCVCMQGDMCRAAVDRDGLRPDVLGPRQLRRRALSRLHGDGGEDGLFVPHGKLLRVREREHRRHACRPLLQCVYQRVHVRRPGDGGSAAGDGGSVAGDGGTVAATAAAWPMAVISEGAVVGFAGPGDV